MQASSAPHDRRQARCRGPTASFRFGTVHHINAALGRGRESLPQLGSGRNVRFPRPLFFSDVRQAKHPIPDEAVCVDFADAGIPLSRFDQLLDKVPVRAVIRPCSHFPLLSPRHAWRVWLLPTGTIANARTIRARTYGVNAHARLPTPLLRVLLVRPQSAGRRSESTPRRWRAPWPVRHLPILGVHRKRCPAASCSTPDILDDEQ